MEPIQKKGLTRSECGKLGYEKSKEKQAKLFQERIDQYNKNPVLCRECSIPIDYKRKHSNTFCSSSCSAIYYNSKRIRNIKYCVNCKNILHVGKKYCSLKCEQDYHRKTRDDLFLSSGEGSKITIKRFLITTFGRQCSICKNEKWLDKPMPLELDHINGNSSDNSKENVRMLCPNCHSFTPTYKGRNKGKGRYSRRMRYREGKSY